MQFAWDLKSSAGSIRPGSQGGIEINDRDSSSPYRKIVTTVDYLLP